MSTSSSFAQRVRLAQETRTRFVEDLGRVMADVCVAVQDRLTFLLNEAGSSRDMQTRRDAWTFYQRSHATWLEETTKQWHASLKPPVNAPKKPLDSTFELVGTEVVENKIIASRMVLSVMEKVSSELNDLRLRIRQLEGAQDFEGHDILRPEVLVLAMIEQWAAIGMPRDAWPLVNDVVHKLLSLRLQQAYINCNEFLISQGVLPTIAYIDRVRRPSPVAAPSSTASLPGKLDTLLRPGQPPPEPREWSGQDGRVADSRTMTEVDYLHRPRHRAVGILGQLRRLLGGSDDSQPDAGYAYHAPSPALAAALAVPPATYDGYADAGTVVDDYGLAGVAHVAREMRRRTTDLKSKAETKGEKATIEIVALMFQSILQEDRIPAGIRVWFARLQMPVLRVALAESDFLGTLDHPARQLIDRMGSCVMGFDATGIHGGALELEIKRVVQVVEQYPETGKRVYQLVYDEFQKFLNQFLTGSTTTQKLVSVAQQVEEKETLTIQYTIEMRNMLKDIPVRDEIREFLFKVWAEVLALAAVRKGSQSTETLGLKKSATDLVWAASAKPNRSDRARVIQDLPQLLQQLRAGMTLLGLTATAQEVHIKTVSDTLADAFLSKTEVIATEQIQAMAGRLANIEDFVTDEGIEDLLLDAESIEMILGLDAARIDVVADGGAKPTPAMLSWAQELQPGAWFTLDHNGKAAKVQFAWRSDRKQLNLFASTDGHSYLLQIGRMAAYLHAGLLVPQEEDTLTVRATRDALGKIDANPERLLS